MPFVAKGPRVQHRSATDGLHRRVESNDKPIPLFDGHRLRQPQLGKAAFSGAQLVTVQQHRLCQMNGGPVVQMDLGAV